MERSFLETPNRNENDLGSRIQSECIRHRKAYLFFLGMFFAATLSIYRSSIFSGGDDGDLQGGWAVVYEEEFGPTRLDNAILGEQGAIVTSDADQETAAASKQAQDSEKNAKSDEPIPINKPMNVVLMYADDWRHDSMVRRFFMDWDLSHGNVLIFTTIIFLSWQGVAGKLPVYTPFLDYLSTQGIRFTHNCVTTSVCWVSRATLHTGMYYSRHKATTPKHNDWYQGWNDTYPQ
jgi:Sulfatase